MRDHIAKVNYAAIIGNQLQNSRFRASYPVQGFSNDLELTFNRGLCHSMRTKSFIIHKFRIFNNVLSCLLDIK